MVLNRAIIEVLRDMRVLVTSGLDLQRVIVRDMRVLVISGVDL